MNNTFKGWYFNHQCGDISVAFIPGTAESGAFVQMLTHKGSRQFAVDKFRVENGIIYCDDCVFSQNGCVIRLPGVVGDIEYGPITPLRSDIMGPFRFLPMECRHGVISMSHSLKGSLMIDDVLVDFNHGIGYIESDSGTSFPSSYLWAQCNNFPEPCSIMLSIAKIPFGLFHFTGCICAIIYKGKEYRLATYNGVHIHSGSPPHLCLTQNGLRLELDIAPSSAGHTLLSPIKGKMAGIVRESAGATMHVRLWKGKTCLFDLVSTHAMYEYMPSCK